MKKVLAITMVVGLLLACAVVAHADANNWIVKVYASRTDNTGIGVTTQVGWRTGYTDGIDTAKGEEKTPLDPGPGDSLAYVLSVFPGTTEASSNDFREPLATNPVTPKVWNFQVYWKGASAIDPIKVTIAPILPNYEFPYSPGFVNVIANGQTTRFDVNNKLGTAGFTFNMPGATATAPATFQLVAAVPEPGSMLALGSGLIGLAGFAIRRRRA